MKISVLKMHVGIFKELVPTVRLYYFLEIYRIPNDERKKSSWYLFSLKASITEVV